MHLNKHHPVLATLGVAALLTLSACGTGDAGSVAAGGGNGMTSSTEPQNVDAGRMGDVMFAQMMIPHHEQAIEMADAALKKDASAEVKGLAAQIKAAQAPEIETMTTWLKQWNAPMSANGGHGGHGGRDGMMSGDDMADLSSADGAAFDKMWLTMMIEHHEGAIEMAERVLKTTTNPQVEEMAKAIVDGQQKEIATMKGLL